MLTINIKGNNYPITSKEAEIINLLSMDSKTSNSTTLLDFFLDEIVNTRNNNWQVVMDELEYLKSEIKQLRKKIVPCGTLK